MLCFGCVVRPRAMLPGSRSLSMAATSCADETRWAQTQPLKGESRMTTWSKEELSKIAATDDLHIAPFREDGVTYGTPTWIWSVAVDDALYVRGYNGQNSRWYQAAVRQKAGRIIAAGITKEAVFELVDGPSHEQMQDRIDEAY